MPISQLEAEESSVPHSNCNQQFCFWDLLLSNTNLLDIKTNFMKNICVPRDRKLNSNLFVFIDSHNEDVPKMVEFKSSSHKNAVSL